MGIEDWIADLTQARERIAFRASDVFSNRLDLANKRGPPPSVAIASAATDTSILGTAGPDAENNLS